MNQLTMLNRIHKDLKIPMGKLIHSAKYLSVMNQMNDFINNYWREHLGYYNKNGICMFNWRRCNTTNYTDVFHWNLKSIEYKRLASYSNNHLKLPQRYLYTTIQDDIKDVKLIPKLLK